MNLELPCHGLKKKKSSKGDVYMRRKEKEGDRIN